MSTTTRLSQQETQHQWLQALVSLWEENGDQRIFFDIRQTARSNGGNLAQDFLEGRVTLRELFHDIRTTCMDEYASKLNAYGLARIDIREESYKELTRKIAFEVLQAFKGVDPKDKTAVCISMAMNWHHFVELLHAKYNLPTVNLLKETTGFESDAEETVLTRTDYETKVTAREHREWEAQVQ